MLRNTAPAPRFWLNALTRKRASFGISKEKSVSKNSSKAFRCLSFMMSYTMLCTSLWASAGMLTRFMSPSTRIIGGTPADKCRSDALFLTANARSCAISTAIRTPRGRLTADDAFRRARTRQRTCGIIAEGFRSNMLMGPQNLPENIRRGAGAHQTGGQRQCGRNVDSVTLLAVCKSQPAEIVRAAARCRALRDFGESYVQEALGKIAGLADLPLTWHFVGRIQTQQDARDRRAFRLGARRRSAAHRRAARRAAAVSTRRR